MPAIISGIVFNDLNSNGALDPGEPGIPNAFVVMRNPGGICTSVQTDGLGVYTFSNITVAGTYTTYETAVNPGAACPPILFGQPPGFTNSSTFRTQTINVTPADIAGNVTLTGKNYGHDNPVLFTCVALGYQVASAGGLNSQFVEINLVTGVPFTISADIGFHVNAIGYNTLDNLIYGMLPPSPDLVRISKNGITTNYGPVPNLPAGSYVVGACDNSGHLFVYVQNNPRYYVIDLDQNSLTFGQLLDPTAGFILDTPPFGTLISAPQNPADWVFNITDGMIYTIPILGPVHRVNPTTGLVTTLATAGVPAAVYGAILSDGDGNIYAINNDTGDIYRIQIAGNNATGQLFSTSNMPAAANDGASCLTALLEIDFGDCPDTAPGTSPGNYRSLLSNDGPRHLIGFPLLIGTNITGENDALQNPTATGDVDDGLIVPLPDMDVTDTSYSLTVPFVNNTGETANIYAWLDFNNDGVFQGNEAFITTISSSATNPRDIEIIFNKPPALKITPGRHFLRIRITTDDLTNDNSGDLTLEDTRSFGPAGDGEVEDYSFQIVGNPAIFMDKTADKSTVQPGDTLTFTFNILNDSAVDAINAVLIDQLPPGTSLVPNSVTINGVVQPGADPEVGIPIGSIPAGTAVIVEFSVTVDSISCPLGITNVATLNYEYEASPLEPIQSGTAVSNEVVVRIVSPSFKQFSVDETVEIPSQKPDIENILDLSVDVEITDKRVVETHKGISADGQNLSGKKLIISGYLNQSIEYTADTEQQSVHAAHFKKPFTTYIVVPEDVANETEFNVVSNIEDVFYDKIDVRHVFKNITLFLFLGLT